MSSYPNAQPAQSSGFGREIATLVACPTSVDVLGLLRPVFGAAPERWVKAIRSVELRTVTRAECAFSAEPLHPANTMHERRFCALLLMVLEHCTGKSAADVRAWTKRLWRGRVEKVEITADGEVKRRYVKKGHQGGLAARLGCSVREVDRYLRVARAAGILSVWQGPKNAPAHLRGKKYAYAVFRWLAELPRQVIERVRSRNQRAAAAAAPAHQPPARASAPGTPDPDAGAEWLAQVRAGVVGRSRPPG